MAKQRVGYALGYGKFTNVREQQKGDANLFLDRIGHVDGALLNAETSTGCAWGFPLKRR